MNLNEEWKPVVGLEGDYEVSNLGRVRSLDREVSIGGLGRVPGAMKLVGKMLKLGFRGKYICVTLPNGRHSRYNYQRCATVHSLVAEAFIGTCPPNMEVCHIDGNKSNNILSNLKYATHLENESHKELHGTRFRGEDHPRAKLDKETVRQIKILIPHLSFTELAEYYCVHPSLISLINCEKLWADVKGARINSLYPRYSNNDSRKGRPL